MPPGDAAGAAGRDRTAVLPLAQLHDCRTARRGRLAVGRTISCTQQQLVVKIYSLNVMLLSALSNSS